MKLKCRFCGADLAQDIIDLGNSPLANHYLEREELHSPEIFYPLVVYFCENCYLVQLPETVSPKEIFSDYPYFSSVSKSWVEHAKKYVEMMISRFRFNQNVSVR